MGLRTLAYYLDPVEPLVAQSALESAGMLAIIGNADWLRMQPFHAFALGGYRLLVSEFELDAAISVLEEACANPLRDGETLIVSGDLLDRALSAFVGILAGGAAIPVRSRVWRD